MQNVSVFNVLILLLVSVVIVYFSNICLRKQEKHKEKTLVAINSNYAGIKKKYASKTIIFLFTFLFTGILSYTIFIIVGRPLNRISYYVFSPIIFSFTISALFDGFFALKYGVIPAGNRSSMDRFVVNPQKKFTWIAYCQIGLAIYLVIAMIVLLVI